MTSEITKLRQGFGTWIVHGLLLLLLAACGGGGGGTSANPVPPQVPPTPPSAQISSISPSAARTTDSLTFTASSSASNLSFSWTFGDGQTSTGYQVAHAYSAPGTYTVELVVADSKTSLSSKATTTVVVALPPIEAHINALTVQQIRREDTVVFSGSGKGQPPLRFEWALDGQPTGSQDPGYAPVSFSKSGAHMIEVRVTDAANRNAVASMTVAVGEPLPIARVTGYSSPAYVNTDLSFSAQGNLDGITYQWNFGDGTPATPASSGIFASHQYALAGTYLVTLTASNSEGQQATATSSVNVTTRPPEIRGFWSTAPDSRIPSAPAPIDHEYSFMFDASGDAPLDFRVDFGDGDSASGQVTTHTYKNPGTFTLRASVTDASGRAASSSRDVQIGAVRYAPLYGGAPAPKLSLGLGPQAARQDITSLSCTADGDILIGTSRAIWQLQADQRVTVYAGTDGQVNAQDGVGNTARFLSLMGMKRDSRGNIYVLDEMAMRKIDSSATVSTVAGFTEALLSGPFYQRGTFAVDQLERIYFVDRGAQRTAALIRRFDPSSNSVEDFAGSNSAAGYVDGPAASARFSNIADLAVDAAGNLLVAEDVDLNLLARGRTIRSISAAGQVTTLTHLPPTGDSGRFDLHIAANGAIYAVTPAWIFALKGGNYTAWSVRFSSGANTLCGNRLVYNNPDYGDGSFLSALDVSTGTTSRLLSGPQDWAHPAMPFRIVGSDPTGYAYIAKGSGIGKMDASGSVSEWVGSFTAAGNADGTLGQARFGNIGAVASNRSGTLWIVDKDAQVMRKIDASGHASTVPGVYEEIMYGAYSSIDETAFIGRDFLYRIAADGTVTKTALPAGLAPVTDSYTSRTPSIVMDHAGALHVALICRILKLDRNGIVTTLIGSDPPLTSSTCGFGIPIDGPASSAKLVSIVGMGLDAEDNLYVLDAPYYLETPLLRKVTPDGTVKTLAGLTMTMPDKSGAKVVNFYPRFDPQAEQMVLVLPTGEMLFKSRQGVVFQSLGFSPTGSP